MSSLSLLSFIFHLFPVYAQSIRSFANSTSLRSLITAENVTSTAMMTENTLGDCCATWIAYESSAEAFYLSVASARAAGRYSTTTLSTYSDPFIAFDYSYVPYTTTDKTPMIELSSFPAASRNSTFIETVTRVLEPTYTGKQPTCDDSSCDWCDPTQCTISAESVQLNYWPVSTVSGYPNLTVTSNATESVTAVVQINGTTFTLTSPTVYLSYAAVSAVNGCSHAASGSASG